MTRHRTPRTLAAATELLERHAWLDAQVAMIDGVRNHTIAAANARADEELAPIVAEQAALAAALEPWWQGARAELTQGRRKSMTIGGCVIGSRVARPTLRYLGGDEDAALAALLEHRWAKAYIRVRYSVDRQSTLAGLEGRHGAGLRELGFVAEGGGDTFFVRRAETGGRIAA